MATSTDRTLSRGEVQKLLEACSPRSSTGLRNRALIALMYRAGLRVSEVLRVGVHDIDSDTCVLHVLRSTPRSLALDPATTGMIDTWLTRRAVTDIPEKAPLFCTLKGSPLSASYIRAFLGRLSRRAGLEKRVSAETLRRTLAVELAQEGVPIGLIQMQLGHGSAETTQRFLARAAPDALVGAMRRRPEWVS